MRYQIILDASPNTAKHYWDTIIQERNRFIDLNVYECHLDNNQPWHVNDTKTGKQYSPDEYFKLWHEIYDKQNAK